MVGWTKKQKMHQKQKWPGQQTIQNTKWSIDGLAH